LRVGTGFEDLAMILIETVKSIEETEAAAHPMANLESYETRFGRVRAEVVVAERRRGKNAEEECEQDSERKEGESDDEKQDNGALARKMSAPPVNVEQRVSREPNRNSEN
jgi:hypothetical protein